MVRLRLLSCQLQSAQLQLGDWVQYVGTDPKLQQDYGNQTLQIRAINVISGIAVCNNEYGQQLVGVALDELRTIRAATVNADNVKTAPTD
ncbi:hypothetical protein H6G89_27125 [Oscillatoria sp. FACHB-1407]|uniref:hypothetical protein n=1 Tax=Oscillatoria sp. FACHB-1407 TaxID=2692847 RepID=UPI0016890051|nr:hypothetical protein [Oscillatoria sp. FACHB-1407]MBD2464683.1 hypothetical protein [Oscillatoria sp. FACHB-1407]